MKIILETLLLSFVLFINFGELNADRPTGPHSWRFLYAGREVRVWNNQHGTPIHIEFTIGNKPVIGKDRRVFLEFVNGIFFFVTTTYEQGQELIARVDNAGYYNRQGFSEPGPPPAQTVHMFGREVSIFGDQHNNVISMRFSDRNICPSQIECQAYQIKPRTYDFGEGRIRVFRLKRGHYMGIQFL